ncbi:MAG: glycosyl hydrolase [Bacteroidota bacterium]
MRFLGILLFCLSVLMTSQAQQPPYTPSDLRLKGFEQRHQLEQRSLVNSIAFESVGPTVFSGRVSDIAVNPDDPSIFYVAYASGGVWKTESNGTAFQPIFEKEAVMTVGDIAVDWKQNHIWVGTGEVNSSRSSYAGVGIYLSTDGGKNWVHKGLSESHHIGRIILHPTDPNTLWVAVLGHLYSPNKERGIYKSSDGGKTWTQTLFVNENTGAVDLIIDPDNPDILYATTWHRERRAWNFVESGQGSGIYKTTDGGNNWALITEKKSGFPVGEGCGRIGVAMGKENGKTVLFGFVDNYFRRPAKEKESGGLLTKEDFRDMKRDDFLKLDKKRLAKYLKQNNFPEKYTADKVLAMAEEASFRPAILTEYLEDANSLLFDTPVIGAEVYRSDDLGKSWTKTHEGFLDRVYNSYGYYFGQIRLEPGNVDKIYLLGYPVLRSLDGGKSFESINGDNVHVDHHALWVNPKRKGHLILGNDGGVNISYDDGDTWIKANTTSVGQFYAVAADMSKPYNIYGGLQDNGVWMGSRKYKASNRWHSTGQYPYKEIMGGDGMQIAVDTRDNNIVYTGFQFGNYFRINHTTGKRKYITPKHALGEAPLRWNWQTPIHLSIHNQDILYMGSNKFHRSFNQGDHFDEISEDLTTGGIKGDVAYSTLTSIHESPLQFGLLYAGSDDGLIHISKDGGNNWERIDKGMPERMWVSKIQASAHVKGRVYAALNGYRWDDFSAYLYQSDDFGKTWTPIGKDLPAEPINVVKEDPVNPDLLYVGTDHGLYVSLDRGQSFMLLNNGLPAVAVHDVVVHPRAHELIVGTHGRSIYVGDVHQLQQMNADIMQKELYAFDLKEQKHSRRWGERAGVWRAPKAPAYKIPVYTKSAGTLNVKVHASNDQLLKEFSADCQPGLNYIVYDLSIEEKRKGAYEKHLNRDSKSELDNIRLKRAKSGDYYLHKGMYKVQINKGGLSEQKEFHIK